MCSGLRTKQFEKVEIENVLYQKIIEPPQTERAAPIVCPPKKDGPLRFFVYYREGNALTKRDGYPIPRMDKYLEFLGEAAIFSTVDAKRGYWQVEIKETDRNRTTFVSHHVLYRFIRMAFGPRNALGTFQRPTDVILPTLRWQFALVYLDDSVMLSRFAQVHIGHVHNVLTIVHNAGGTLELKKCEFFTKTID